MYKLNIDILHRKKLHSYLPSSSTINSVAEQILYENLQFVLEIQMGSLTESEKRPLNLSLAGSYNIFVILNSNIHTECFPD